MSKLEESVNEILGIEGKPTTEQVEEKKFEHGFDPIILGDRANY